MLENDISKEMYLALNKSLEKQNKEYISLMNTKEYKVGTFICRLIRCVKTGNWKSVRGYFRNRRWNKKILLSGDTGIQKDRRDFTENDYFIKDKIAVYTCVFGKYDQLQEPIIKPDNIDYFIVTDQKIPQNSLWQPIAWERYCSSSLSNAEKNRFFKMHPDCIFPEYSFSIYIDGNIKVISDLTPYVRLLGKNGMAFHYHNQRKCAYKELEAIQLAYKVDKRVADSYEKYLKTHRFPENYGLLECNVIVREHNNSICKKVMNEWWDQFVTQINRDQVSLPYVLFENEIKVEDVATLGSDVYSNLSFRIGRHI